jgi:hypothetical protein
MGLMDGIVGNLFATALVRCLLALNGVSMPPKELRV